LCVLGSLPGHAQDFALPCLSNPEIADKQIAVRHVVHRHQDLARARYGHMIEVRFMDDSRHCDLVNMEAGLDERGHRPRIFIYHGLLTRLSIEGIIAATCHELGHFFGEVTRGQAGETGRPVELLMSVEGEADYFAGRCLADYYGSIPGAVEAGRKLYGSLHIDMKINENLARGRAYEQNHGIDTKYPDPHCRMLSLISGALGESRPACWYNPG
jgi:hypothetical protein